MAIDKYINRLKKIDQMIRHENTGKPKDLAQNLGISESHVYNCIQELKDMGLPIAYCRIRQTYYYTDPVQLKISLSIIDLTTNEIKEINGGCKFLNFSGLLQCDWSIAG